MKLKHWISAILISTPVLSIAQIASGTAFFYNQNGDMFTNRHVVEGCRDGSIKVRTSDMKWNRARILAIDSRVDIAAISIDRRVESYASFRLFPGTKNISIPEEVEDAFSAGFSAPDRNNYKLQPKWGQIQSWQNANAFPYVNRMRMDAYPGASGSPILDYYGLLIGIVFASSVDPAPDLQAMRRVGYGDKWIFIHNNNALLLFANRFGLNYSAWDKWDRKDPDFVWKHAERITGLVLCEL